MTLPAQDHAARRAQVRRHLQDRLGPAWLLVTDPRNVRYLSGFHGSSGQLLLGPGADQDRVITDERYTARAAAEAPDLPTILDRDAGGVALHAAGAAAGPAASSAAGPAAEASDVPTLAVEAAHLSWAAAQALVERARAAGIRIVATTDLVEGARAVKDDAEVARIAAACTITQEALGDLIADHVRPGVTERELAIRLERAFVDRGADGIAFPSIVASGPNGAIPHHEPTERVLAAGDLVTIDCGALVDGYHADHTRTVAVPGAPVDARLQEIHRVVVAAQAAGRDAARVGVSGEQIDAAARQVVDDAGFGAWFVHGTGHGVGLAIHEAPAVARGSTASLPAGTVLTVEPGIYLPGHGGVRIEDTLVLRGQHPADALTDTPRTLR